MEYGLSFYRNHQVLNYEQDGVQVIPPEQHILVARESYTEDLRQLLKGRSYEALFYYPTQGLVIYSVAAQVK